MSKGLRNLLFVLLAVVLLSILVALVYKTQAIDTSVRQQINTHLRDMKQLDAEWNLDVLRSKIGIDKNYDKVTTPLQLLQAHQNDLILAVEESHADNIKQAADSLQEAVNTKIDLIDRFKSQHSLLKNSLNFLPTAVTQLQAAIVKTRWDDQQSKEDAPGEKSDNLGISRADAMKTANTAKDMLTELLKYNLNPDAEGKRTVNGLVDVLADKQKIYEEPIQGQLGMIVNHARTVLKQKDSEDALLLELGQLPIIERINALGDHFEQGFDLAFKTQDKWRTALIAYASGLLLLLVLAGIFLWRSYRTLDKANASLELRVTERTQDLSNALTDLKESQLQLVQSEKMASLGQMVAGIAHEINTPLAYVKSGLEVLHTRIDDVDILVNDTADLMGLMADEQGNEDALAEKFASVQELSAAFVETEAISEVKSLLGDGLHGIEQISEIVKNLKDFSRLDRARLDRFNVNEGIASTLTIARNIVKHRQIEQNLADVPPIICSPSQINQVFLNLINNACQATNPENGVVTITTKALADGVAIDISDNGKGIQDEHLSRIFDPFFTTKKVGEGTGLGLSIVQRIIKEHGGTIQVSSKVDVGTRFTVLLPYQATVG
ncbi:DAHL domain-containing protein [Thiothrix unzii]|jgi:signal transduction histidine kinase|uniref:DAHL domain-containing protein n=1 Tax=Thiothrix unzii TaxID=111769 RepID=UPI002A36491E|nr:DAHL domain-containing protein [Thiothrix unzii]MDX9988118.1 DAHL domain-containing protein [Thiothrix unzii]